MKNEQIPQTPCQVQQELDAQAVAERQKPQYEVNAQIWSDTRTHNWERQKKTITWVVENTIEGAQAVAEGLRGNASFLRVWVEERA